VSRRFPLLFLALVLGCENDPPKRTPESVPAGKVEIKAAPEGDDAALVIMKEAELARADGKRLLVYVGASWCEPCERFHKAAVAGELDKTFPGLRLLEFDRDRDEARLGRAGCLSQLIPLFAKPDAQGRCSNARVEGSIKGDGAVANITPRLRSLLE
jgi:hypothetical protein